MSHRNYQSLIPPDCATSVSGLDEILAHRDLIPSWIEYWNRRKIQAKREIKTLQKIAKALSHQTIADLRQSAQSFEHPVFSTFGSLDGRYPPQHVFPDDDESSRRQTGDTTLNVCGWCHHARPRPDDPPCTCVLHPVCILMPEPLIATLTDGRGLSFHSPCALLHATDDDLAACLAHLEEQQIAWAKERVHCASCSRRLQNLMAE